MIRTETFFVGSIPFKSNAAFLEDLFRPFGEIEHIEVVADWENPTAEPHAYVTIRVGDPVRLVEALDGKKFGRLYIRVHKRVSIQSG